MVDTESDHYGLRLFAIADSYVSEVQTVSDSFAPEFGKTAGISTTRSPGRAPTHFMATFDLIGRPPDLVPGPSWLRRPRRFPST